ncbi:MAG: substrate-binding domain-containing protein [Actinomycetota bacterium]|nr:substrate-binding domain-containing protein [Actinomycetota bacterium]
MTNFKDFPLWIVAAHFLNIVFMLFMGRSGLEILSAFPKFYLSDDCPPGKEWLRLTHKVVSADSAHPWTSLDEEEPWSPVIALPGRRNLGLGRHWHFLTLQFWIVTGAVYVTLLFATGYWVSLFVEPAPPEAIGSDAVDILAGEVHGSGVVAIVSAGPTEPDLQAWISAMRARLANYPRLHLVPVQTGATTGPENTVVADRLMAAYPNLKGIIGAGPANVGPLARAVDQAGKKGKVVVTGEADPNGVRPWIENGTVHAVVYYNTVHLGYLTYWAVSQMLHHRDFAPRQTVPGLADPVSWDATTHTLVLGQPVVITRANVSKLNF